MALLQEMQQLGQPPKEIMEQLAPGSDLEALLDGKADGDALCSVM
jgi:hypothetical protein